MKQCSLINLETCVEYVEVEIHRNVWISTLKPLESVKWAQHRNNKDWMRPAECRHTTLKDNCTHTPTHTLSLQQFLYKHSQEDALLSVLQSTAQFISNRLQKSNRCSVQYTQVDRRTQMQSHTLAVYWTLRVRADTPWCQSLSSWYLGPTTNRVVVLFTLPSSTRE